MTAPDRAGVIPGARELSPTPSAAEVRRARAQVGAALAACLLLFACGGSGSGDDGGPAGQPTGTAQTPASPTAPETALPASPSSPAPAAPPASDPASAPAAAPEAPVAIKAEVVAAGLASPWSLAFLPDGSMLVTEKPGTLRRVTAAGQVSAPLAGVPPVDDADQGGLLDVVLSPTFAADRTIFFTYSEPAGNGTRRTAVARAELGEAALSDVLVIYRQTPARPGGIHYGSRLVFDREGYLFVTLGERGEQDRAQDLGTTQGKVVRIRADGTVPADNPVFPPGAVPGIWSYGHRNPQGAALNPVTGDVWVGEHGPRGGDEINRIVKGADYGWPRITYGLDYGSGEPLGEATTAPGVESPLHIWVPLSVAPAGMVFYTGDKLPGWQGSLLVGTLAGKMLARLALEGDAVVGETQHLQSLGERIRDIRQGPDGFPYLLTDSGRLMRVVPN